jgi:RNA polymerase sigma-70 factor (ECF subfamily)
MERINLKELYPFYQTDRFIMVSDEIAEYFRQFERAEHAAHERRRTHKAFYSLDTDGGIEDDVITIALNRATVREEGYISGTLYRHQ